MSVSFWSRYRATVGESTDTINLTDAVRLQSLAVLLAIVVYLAGGGEGWLEFALLLCLATLSVWSTSHFLRANRRTYGQMEARHSMLDYLYGVLHHKRAGGSFIRALGEALKGVNNKQVKNVMASTRRTYLMHQDGAMGLIASGEKGVMEEVAGANRLARGNRAEMEEAAQRYATFNMFISTIAPSFLIFAFIGDAILSQSGSGLLFFSSLLLLVIPVVYSFGCMLMWRRLFA